jgi:prepilin signal peptidase PulO-like enzyme (type II secretory pathway)
MFDPETFVVGGVSLIATVFGLVEFIKDLLGWEGKKVTMLAALMGAIVMVIFQLITIVPQPYEQIVSIFFVSIAFGLSASGYYKFVNKRLPDQSSKG